MTVNVDIVDNPAIIGEGNLITKDADTEDGGKSIATGSLTVSMENETSVTVKINGVDQQVSLSELAAKDG